MYEANYDLRIHAKTYPELRDAIRTLAEEHGLLEAAGRVNTAHSVHPTLPESATASAVARARAADERSKDQAVNTHYQGSKAPEAPKVGTTDALIWYHKPDTKEVWQEPEAGRRKGVYKVDESTAQDLLQKYEGADDAGEQEVLEAAEQEAAEEQQEDAPAEEENNGPADQPALTLDDVRQAVMEYAKQNGATKGKALVNKFGVNKLSELSEDQYPAVFAEAGGEAA